MIMTYIVKQEHEIIKAITLVVPYSVSLKCYIVNNMDSLNNKLPFRHLGFFIFQDNLKFDSVKYDDTVLEEKRK